ncbi:TIGR02677 family protein [Parafrankia discariae]|uniref:TIGR02677 family protein n=1 Tax=Parafrankia discariae TaxID=365528 RepID=UPI0006888976|nr:TIGR02677 family protein [Parafrankia discariae]
MAARRVPPEMFRFATEQNADLYTAILHVFGDANERLETALGLDDIDGRLASVGFFRDLDPDELGRALAQLGKWQLLDVIQNHSADYSTAAEYERGNLHYSLTRRGEAAFAGVQHALEVLASAGALQTAVLDAITDRLDALYGLLLEPTSADRRVFTTLSELESHLEALRSNTKQFNGELQRLLRAENADLDTFHEVKRATVTYLQEFVTDLDHRSRAIRDAIRRVESLGVATLRRRALLGAELSPMGAQDPVPAWLEHRRLRWEGLRLWFDPGDGARPRADELHTVARRAIVALLATLERIGESRRRSSSAARDFQVLARVFAAAPAEDDLHRLWGAAFGLTPARHAHLRHTDPELIPVGMSWAAAPSVEVSTLLRRGGRAERFSRTGRVRDVAAVRREREERARRERAELEAVWARLRTDGPVRLSALGTLDHEALARLLDLLGQALDGPVDSSGARRATTSDGQVEIVARPTGDGRLAVIRTPRGVLTAPDHIVDIALLGRPVARGIQPSIVSVPVPPVPPVPPGLPPPPAPPARSAPAGSPILTPVAPGSSAGR